jgi:hypothetical protein
MFDHSELSYQLRKITYDGEWNDNGVTEFNTLYN